MVKYGSHVYTNVYIHLWQIPEMNIETKDMNRRFFAVEHGPISLGLHDGKNNCGLLTDFRYILERAQVGTV